MTIDIDSTKYCAGCKRNLPGSAFWRNKRNRDGLDTRCRECANAAKRRRYRDDPIYRQRILDQYSIWQTSNPEKARAKKNRWRSRHLEVVRRREVIYVNNRRRAVGKISLDDVSKLLISQRFKCVYCYFPIREKYHVDHKTPLSRGGTNTPDNIQITCPTCNLYKSAKTHEEYMRVLECQV